MQCFRNFIIIGNSKIDQKITLANDSKRLDFNTTVDWSEKHKMLRVHFPLLLSLSKLPTIYNTVM